MIRYTTAVVVDGNSTNIDSLIEAVRGLGFRQVVSCPSVQKALSTLQKTRNKSSVRILFVNLETVKGSRHLLTRIMADPELSHIQVIIMKANKSSRLLCDMFQCGAVAHLPDPSDVKSIRKLLLSLDLRMPKSA